MSGTPELHSTMDEARFMSALHVLLQPSVQCKHMLWANMRGPVLPTHVVACRWWAQQDHFKGKAWAVHSSLCHALPHLIQRQSTR